MASADSQALKESMQRHLFFSQAKSSSLATSHDHYRCLALAVRDRLLKNWVDTADTYTREHVRTATYLSAEYLLGPHPNAGTRRGRHQLPRPDRLRR